MSYGASYDEYSRLFLSGSTPVVPNSLNEYQTIITILLALATFGSLSLGFLVDNKSRSPVLQLLYILIASFSIGLGSIYASNFFGVYI